MYALRNKKHSIYGKSDKIRIYYIDSPTPNFGDILNIDIFNKMFGFDVKRTNKRYCEIVAIGSLLDSFIIGNRYWLLGYKYFSPRMFIWGTGFIASPKYENEKLLRRVDIHAVRGYNSLERLRKITGRLLTNVVVADPGLLASRLFHTSKIKKKYTIGIIPHFVDKTSPLLTKIKVENSTILDIQQSPEIFMAQLAECENIISSAMHGLIAADSLGIPNLRMVLSDKIIGGDYKYNDYYSAFGIENHNYIDLNRQDFSDKDLPSIKANYKITQKKVVELQDALISCFPYQNGGS